MIFIPGMSFRASPSLPVERSRSGDQLTRRRLCGFSSARLPQSKTLRPEAHNLKKVSALNHLSLECLCGIILHKAVDNPPGCGVNVLVVEQRRPHREKTIFQCCNPQAEVDTLRSNNFKEINLPRHRNPRQIFFDIKYYAVEVAGIVAFLAWLGRAVWHELRW